MDFIHFIPQGKSYFYLLKNNAVPAVPTGRSHWIEFLPNHMYCFTPSMEINSGQVIVRKEMPEFLKDFQFCQEIKMVESNKSNHFKNIHNYRFINTQKYCQIST